MTNTSHPFLPALAEALLRCWMFGLFLLLSWIAVSLALGDRVYAWHGSLFGLTPHEVSLVFYCAMGFFKLLVLTLFFIPWAAIRFVLRSKSEPNVR